MKYNPEIHHRRSIRLKNHDYSSNGIYFVTICIHEKKALFGNIKNEAVICNSSGEIAKNIWDMIPEKFSGVKIDSFVIMPNHIHGILVFEKQEDSFRTIGDIIRWYKGRCTFEIRKNCSHFSWQRNYYERIIRNEKSLDIAREYIEANPYKWTDDLYFVD